MPETMSNPRKLAARIERDGNKVRLNKHDRALIVDLLRVEADSMDPKDNSPRCEYGHDDPFNGADYD